MNQQLRKNVKALKLATLYQIYYYVTLIHLTSHQIKCILIFLTIKFYTNTDLVHKFQKIYHSFKQKTNASFVRGDHNNAATDHRNAATDYNKAGMLQKFIYDILRVILPLISPVTPLIQ